MPPSSSPTHPADLVMLLSSSMYSVCVLKSLWQNKLSFLQAVLFCVAVRLKGAMEDWVGGKSAVVSYALDKVTFVKAMPFFQKSVFNFHSVWHMRTVHVDEQSMCLEDTLYR